MNAEWDLIRTATGHRQIVEEGEVFAQLDFVLTTTRRPSYYVLNIVLPIMLMSALSVLVFILPFQSGEKASYALTVLLSYAVLLTIVASEMPPISDNVSILGRFRLKMGGWGVGCRGRRPPTPSPSCCPTRCCLR